MPFMSFHLKNGEHVLNFFVNEEDVRLISAAEMSDNPFLQGIQGGQGHRGIGWDGICDPSALNLRDVIYAHTLSSNRREQVQLSFRSGKEIAIPVEDVGEAIRKICTSVFDLVEISPCVYVRTDALTQVTRAKEHKLDEYIDDAQGALRSDMDKKSKVKNKEPYAGFVLLRVIDKIEKESNWDSFELSGRALILSADYTETLEDFIKEDRLPSKDKAEFFIKKHFEKDSRIESVDVLEFTSERQEEPKGVKFSVKCKIALKEVISLDK